MLGVRRTVEVFPAWDLAARAARHRERVAKQRCYTLIHWIVDFGFGVEVALVKARTMAMAMRPLLGPTVHSPTRRLTVARRPFQPSISVRALDKLGRPPPDADADAVTIAGGADVIQRVPCIVYRVSCAVYRVPCTMRPRRVTVSTPYDVSVPRLGPGDARNGRQRERAEVRIWKASVVGSCR